MATNDVQKKEHIAKQSLIHDVLSLLRRRKLVIVVVWLSIVLTVAIGSFMLQDVYKANATILIEQTSNAERSLLLGMNLPIARQAFDWINSEMVIMKSYPVASRVVQELDLDKTGRQENQKSANESLKKIRKAIREFKGKLTIKNTEMSNVVVIGYQDRNPRLTASVVNKVIDTYIEYRLEVHDNSEKYDFFEKQLKVTEEKLRKFEQKEVAYKQQQEVVSVTDQRKILLNRIADYESRLTTVRTRRIGRDAILEVIKEQLQNEAELDIPNTESSDSPSREKHIAKLRGELLDMEIERRRLLQKFTPQYEEVINLNEQIGATKAKIKNEIQQIVRMEELSIRALHAEEKELGIAIDKIKNELQEFAKIEYELAQITRGVDDNKEIFSMLLKQREEARISLAKSQREIKVKIGQSGRLSLASRFSRTENSILWSRCF